MTSTMAVPHLNQQPPVVRANSTAAARDQRYRTVQLALFTVGAVLMPLGIIAICLGWYGTAHAHYAYDQSTYLISGGILGLGLTFLGGFLYFGAWLAKIGIDQRDTARQLSDALFVVADLISRQSQGRPGRPEFDSSQTDDTHALSEQIYSDPDHPESAGYADPGAVIVLAGSGSTAHRRDCALIGHREDLRLLTANDTGVTTCRVCRPVL